MEARLPPMNGMTAEIADQVNIVYAIREILTGCGRLVPELRLFVPNTPAVESASSKGDGNRCRWRYAVAVVRRGW
jgi:hypothetical protein